MAYRAPLHSASLLDFLALRAVPGLEECDGRTYRRGLRLPHGTATVALRPGDRFVAATIDLADVRDLAPAVARCRRLFDLDADPAAVDGTLADDPALSAVVAAEPGVRVPRAADGFEMAVRAIVGQQISVAAARAILGRLLAAATPTPHGTAGVGGRTLRAFLTPAELLHLPDAAFGMPAARRESLRVLARAADDGRLDLEPGADPGEARALLMGLPGVGAWTADYVVMRALGDPDVLLPTDVAVRRGAAALGITGDLTTRAERWRPWRSYALIRLWRAS